MWAYKEDKAKWRILAAQSMYSLLTYNSGTVLLLFIEMCQ
jgi:hypothetical protein